MGYSAQQQRSTTASIEITSPRKTSAYRSQKRRGNAKKNKENLKNKKRPKIKAQKF